MRQHEPAQGIWCIISLREKAKEPEMEWEIKYQYTAATLNVLLFRRSTVVLTLGGL